MASNAEPARTVVDIAAQPVAAVAPADWDDIWRLTERYYATDREYVEQTLRTHQRLVLFRTRDARELVGMAAVDVYPGELAGRRIAVIFTSHVLLDDRYRGQNLIQRVGFRTFMEARRRYPLRPVYWFFDTFSYKSYLLLPHNFRDYWPHFDRATPPWERSLMNHLATEAYGDAWRPELGVVARSGRKRLRAETAPIEPALFDRPELAFFVRANPGHAEGDMLVCLCPLTMANWWSAAVRAVGRMRGSAARRRSGGEMRGEMR